MAKKQKIEQTRLQAALDFLSIAQVNLKYEYTNYAMFSNGKAFAFDAIIAAGIDIDEDLVACPNLDLLAVALLKVGTLPYQIIQIAANNLLVHCDDFRAYIPCADVNLINFPQPDPVAGVISDDLLKAMVKVLPMIETKPDATVLESCVHLRDGSASATNNTMVIDAWHGLDLPPDLLLPKRCVTSLAKTKKHLASFGYSPQTMTFYFTDGSWMRTQLYQAKIPNVRTLFPHFAPQRGIPQTLFESARQVSPFSTDGYVYIDRGYIHSHDPFNPKEIGSQFKMPIGENFTHNSRAYDAHDLNVASRLALKWNENHERATYFVGDNVRGLISHRIIPEQPHAQYAPEGEHVGDEDIPF